MMVWNVNECVCVRVLLIIIILSKLNLISNVKLIKLGMAVR